MPPSIDSMTESLPADNSRTDVIGILGGMGPAATADFYTKLVASTPATRDQEHPRVVIWADPTIPDRSQALLGNGEDPTPWLIRGIDKLTAAGATVIVIPCNTAHAFLPRLVVGASVPILNMIDLTAAHIKKSYPSVEKVGLLATTGTINSAIYQHALESYGLNLLTPTDAQGESVMVAIERIKAGRRDSETAELLQDSARELCSQGAQVVIAGCTEIVLGLPSNLIDVPLIDPSQVVVDSLLARMGYSIPE